MDPIQQLLTDHETIESVLLKTVKMREDLSQNILNKSEWNDFVSFVRDFADGIHHHREEEGLFPELYQAGLPQNGGPISCMLHDHEQGRYLIQKVCEGLSLWDSNPDQAKEMIIDHAQAYVDHLRSHIQKENQVLFKMAQRMLSPEAKERLSLLFQKIDSSIKQVPA